MFFLLCVVNIAGTMVVPMLAQNTPVTSSMATPRTRPGYEYLTFPDITFRARDPTTTPSRYYFCQKTAFTACFGRNDGSMVQKCGFNENTPRVVTLNGTGGSESCNSHAVIMELLQQKGRRWNSNAVLSELQKQCPRFRHMESCLDAYSNRCNEAYREYGILGWKLQFNFMCGQDGGLATTSYFECMKSVRTGAEEDTFFSDCVEYSRVIGFNYTSANLTGELGGETCEKFRAYVGCKAYWLVQKCGATNATVGRQAARFFLASVKNGQMAAKINQNCTIVSSDDVDLAMANFANYRPPTTTTMSTTTTTSTTTPTTTTSRRFIRYRTVNPPFQRPTRRNSAMEPHLDKTIFIGLLFFFLLFSKH